MQFPGQGTYRNQQSDSNSSGGTGGQNKEQGQYREKDGGRHRRDREDRDRRPRLKERRGNKDNQERDRSGRSKEAANPVSPPAPTILKIASKNPPPESASSAPTTAPSVVLSSPSASPVKIFNPVETKEAPAPVKSKILEPAKLLNDNLDFCYDSAHKVLSDQTNFTVVGVIGLQGSGKSTILSQLCGYSFKNITDFNNSPNEENSPPFQLENEESIMNAKHQTGGIDLCVSPDKLILLDVQPILSSSVLSQMIKNESKYSLSSEVVSFENLHELQSIQLGVFLLSICHVVIVVQDYVTDLNLWHYLRTIEMLKFSIPDVSTIASWNENQGIENEYYPECVFVFNKLSEKHFTPMHTNGLRNLLDRVCPPNLKTKEQFIPLPNEKEKKIENSKNEEKHANFFLLPVNEQLYEKSDQINIFNDRYSLLSSQLTKKILSLKRKNFQRNITEREWLRCAAKAWDVVRKSSFINEYNKTLQKMGLYRT